MMESPEVALVVIAKNRENLPFRMELKNLLQLPLEKIGPP